MTGGPWRDRTHLVRKETWYRPQQLEALESLARVINRERAGDGHRITVSTLQRIAVDLLLERSLELFGSTEAELRASVMGHYSTSDTRSDHTEGDDSARVGTPGTSDQKSDSI